MNRIKTGCASSIELKRGEIPDVTINQLYKYTEMQVTFGCNMLALDKGLPRTMNIKQFIQAWIDHRIEVIRRRTRFELAKAEARAHILEGYLKALDHLDEVVKIIRASGSRDAARLQLMAHLCVYRPPSQCRPRSAPLPIDRLEREKSRAEYKELLEKIAHLRAVLASEEHGPRHHQAKSSEIAKKHTEERKPKSSPPKGSSISKT